MNIIKLDSNYRNSVNAYIRCLWAGPYVVSHGNLYDTSSLPGFVAESDGAMIGAILYRINNGECEISALFSLVQGMGAGTKLIDSAVEAAKRENARRIWLVTTNDNTHAIRFYQKYGFSLKAVHIGALEAGRKLKKELPELGNDNIPIKHELEFEILL